MRAGVRTNLKPSGNEFINGIPEGWQAVPMKSLGWYASSGIDKKEQEDEPSVLMVNYMDIYGNASREISRSRSLMSTTCPAWKIKECSLQKGDLVFTPSSETAEDIGLSALIIEDLPNTVFSYHVLRFRFTKPVDLNFKKYLCNNSAVLHQFSSVCQGSTRQILNRGEFRNAVVVLPPSAEQRSIAAFLDRETGRVDRLVAMKRELIERLKEKRTALISRTVTHGLPPAAPCAAGLPANPTFKPSGLSSISDIPSDWIVSKVWLERVACNIEYQDGNHGELHPKPEDYVNDGIPFVMANHLIGGRIDFQSCNYIEPEKAASLRIGFAHAGDILLTHKGTIGRVGMVQENRFPYVMLTPQVTYYRCLRNIAPRFLFWFFQGKLWQDQMYLVSSLGTTRGYVGLLDQRFLNLLLPPLPEQAAIAAYLDEETAKLDALVTKVESAAKQLLEYRTALIAAAVTGKIDVRKTVA